MVKFMIEIPTEECFQRCIKAAKKYIAAYDDLEKHGVGINNVIQAVSLAFRNRIRSVRSGIDLAFPRISSMSKVRENLIAPSVIGR